MQLIYEHEKRRFVVEADYSYNTLLKKLGFVWDKDSKKWFTLFSRIAAKLIKVSKIKDKEIIIEGKSREEKRIRASQAISSTYVPLGPDRLRYYPFQVAGIELMLSEYKTLLADPMGLGKTIQVCGFIRELKKAQKNIKTLIVCPSSVKIKWKNELVKWSGVDDINIIYSTKIDTTKEIIIINYDIIARNISSLLSLSFDLIVLDECHLIKNTSSGRSKCISMLNAKRQIAVTGTPFLNRPIEIYAALNWLSPKAWGSKFEFAKRFCDLKKGYWGWDYNGSANLDELNQLLLSTVMIRRSKALALPQLPKKTREIIPIKKKDNIWTKIVKALGLEKVKDYESLANELLCNANFKEKHVSELRQEAALEKLPFVFEHIDSLLESVDKIVVFAHHIAVLDALYDKYKDMAVLVKGGLSAEQKYKVCEKFQTNKKIRIFIGSILAAGVGIDLTAASNVVFAEVDWVPGNMNQAEDRCHRIGTVKNVLVQHVVLDGSIEAYMVHTLLDKQRILEEALDTETKSIEEILS